MPPQRGYPFPQPAHLLKNFDHQGIVRFHRMLKTTNNFYLVLGEYSGTPLEEVLEHGPRIMTFAQSTPSLTQRRPSPSRSAWC